MTWPKPIYSESGHFCIALNLSHVSKPSGRTGWHPGCAAGGHLRRSWRRGDSLGGGPGFLVDERNRDGVLLGREEVDVKSFNPLQVQQSQAGTMKFGAQNLSC